MAREPARTLAARLGTAIAAPLEAMQEATTPPRRYALVRPVLPSYTRS